MFRTRPIWQEPVVPRPDGLRSVLRRLEQEVERTPRPTPRRPPAVATGTLRLA